MIRTHASLESYVNAQRQQAQLIVFEGDKHACAILSLKINHIH